jgi:hypothetical protein
MVVECFSCAAKPNVHPYHQQYQPRGPRIQRTINNVRYGVGCLRMDQLSRHAAPASAPRESVAEIRTQESSSDGEVDAEVRTQELSSDREVVADVGTQELYSDKEVVQPQAFHEPANIPTY